MVARVPTPHPCVPHGFLRELFGRCALPGRSISAVQYSTVRAGRELSHRAVLVYITLHYMSGLANKDAFQTEACHAAGVWLVPRTAPLAFNYIYIYIFFAISIHHMHAAAAATPVRDDANDWAKH